VSTAADPNQDADLRELAVGGRLDACFERALERYGGEVLGFLAALVQDEETARELYAQLCTDLWKALPAFRWEASFRSWIYTAARNAVSRHRRTLGRRKRFRPLTSETVETLAQRDRTDTAPHLKTDNKTKIAALRSRLDPDDQMILVLRIDRDLSWSEIAEVVHGGPLSPSETTRASANMRKRFERIKDRLRELAVAEGLLARE
jgi:RNA polymerase sigma-70 factor (ECF subfamily)